MTKHFDWGSAEQSLTKTFALAPSAAPKAHCPRTSTVVASPKYWLVAQPTSTSDGEDPVGMVLDRFRHKGEEISWFRSIRLDSENGASKDILVLRGAIRLHGSRVACRSRPNGTAGLPFLTLSFSAKPLSGLNRRSSRTMVAITTLIMLKSPFASTGSCGWPCHSRSHLRRCWNNHGNRWIAFRGISARLLWARTTRLRGHLARL